jgi:hypothetical protein
MFPIKLIESCRLSEGENIYDIETKEAPRQKDKMIINTLRGVNVSVVRSRNTASGTERHTADKFNKHVCSTCK